MNDEISNEEKQKMKIKASASMMCDTDLIDYYDKSMDELNEMFVDVERVVTIKNITDRTLDDAGELLGEIFDKIESRKARVKKDILNKTSLSAIDNEQAFKKLKEFIQKERNIVDHNMESARHEIKNVIQQIMR